MQVATSQLFACRRIYNNVAECYVVRKKRKKRALKTVIIIALIIGCACWYYFCNVAPSVFAVINDKTIMMISESIDDSASELIADLKADDYVIVRTNADGEVTYVGVNSVSMNIFARNVTESVRRRLAVIENNGIAIPAGTFTGIPFLMSSGATVDMRALTLAVVDADFVSTFDDAGINQTVHKMYVIVEVTGEIVLPGYVRSISNSSQILISETVIVGKTPDTYFDF